MSTGYGIDPALVSEGRDKDDAHVLAAAEHGHVDYLVTSDIPDFRAFAGSCDFEIFTPDEMLCLIDERRPDPVDAAAKKQPDYWAKRSGKPLPDALASAGAPVFSHHMKNRLARWARSGRY